MKSINSGKHDKLLKLLHEASGNSLDIYYVIFEEYLNNSDNPPELLRLILEFPDTIGHDDGASEKVSPQVEKDILQQYKSFLVKTVELLVNKNSPVDLFYKELWKATFCAPTSPKDTDQRAVTLKILNEDIPLLPYYQANDLVSMDSDDFAKELNTLKPQIQEAIHMLNRHFSQKTEESSQLLRLSNNLTRKEACIYWATLLSIIKESAYYAGRRSVLADKNSKPNEDKDAKSEDNASETILE